MAHYKLYNWIGSPNALIVQLEERHEDGRMIGVIKLGDRGGKHVPIGFKVCSSLDQAYTQPSFLALWAGVQFSFPLSRAL